MREPVAPRPRGPGRSGLARLALVDYPGWAGGVVASRIQQIETFIAWCYDPKLSTAAAGKNNAPWWKHYVQTWMTRRRNPNEAVYFREQIEDAAARFRQQVDASRTLVADLTPLEILSAHAGSRLLAELVNKPGRSPYE